MGTKHLDLLRMIDEKDGKSIILFDLSFFGGPMSALLKILTDRLTAPAPNDQRPLTVVTPNPEQVMLTRNDPAFLQALQAAAIRIPDGIGLVYASKILRWRFGSSALTARLPGKDVVAALLAWAHPRQETVLVIGGRQLGQVRPGQEQSISRSQTIARQTKEHAPAYSQLLPIQKTDGTLLENKRWFWTEGYRQVETPTPSEEEQLDQLLDQLRPDLVFVAFGAPWQEEWLAAHHEQLHQHGVQVAMAVGGTFDTLTGKLGHAPRWMEQFGLEWAYRLWQEPWRWRRQRRLLGFVGLVIQSMWKADSTI